MHMKTPPVLTADEVDDLLYLTRANEAQDLQQTTKEFAEKYQCTTRDVLEACIDSETGNTTLHYCSANGLANILHSTLRDLGVEVAESNGTVTAASPLLNHQNKQGSTPLHWASYNGHLEVVKLLVKAGADMWVKNAAGHLAMFEAERADKNEIVQFLLEAGGREVERTGTEGQPSAEDVADVSNSEEGIASASTQGNSAMEVD